MRKVMKKILISILSVILLTCISLVGFGCNGCGGNGGGNEEAVTDGPSVLTEWESEKTADYVLGDIYVLDYAVDDVNGARHFYDATVKNSVGNVVQVVNHEFVIEDVNGYTVYYSISISGVVYRRKVIIDVIDQTAPTVVSPSFYTGFVGEEYNLPEIIVNDDFDGSMTPEIKVYKKGNENNPITVTNNKFTPTSVGSHVLKVTSTDSAGNTLAKEFEFSIRNFVDISVLENFDDQSSIVNSINGDQTRQEWLEEFQGRNGVVHVKGSSAEKSYFYFKFLRQKEEYAFSEFGSIIVSAYVVITQGDGTGASVYQTTSDGQFDYDNNGDGLIDETIIDGVGDGCTAHVGVEAGKWVDIEIRKNNFGEWDTFISEATGANGTQLFWSWTKYADFYIDEIRYENPMVLEKFSSEASALNSLTDKANQEWVSDFQGRKGVLHLKASGDMQSFYSFKFIGDASYYPAQFKSIIITLYADIADAGTTSADVYKTNGGDEAWVPIPEGKWVELVITKEDMGDWDTFIAEAISKDGTQLFWNWTPNVDFYIDEIRYETTTVSVGNLLTGFVNQEYTLPAISVSDGNGEITSTVSVYHKDNQNSPLNITDNKFVPIATGVHVLKVEFISSGITIEKTYEFSVRSDIERAVLENFDDESSLLNSLNGGTSGSDHEWLNEYQGRSGVLHLKASGDMQSFYSFKFLRQKSFYENTDIKAIVISLYLDITNPAVTGADVYKANGQTDDYYIGVNEGKWTELVIPKAMFGDWDAFLTDATSSVGTQLFWSWTPNVDFYIDEIRYETAEITADLTIGFVEQEYSFASVTASDKNGSLTPVLTVYHIDDLSAPLTISQGKFTPETEGVHVLKVEATDIEGNKTVRTFEFLVRQYAEPTVIENFDCAESFVNSVNGVTSESDHEWLESFEGKSGVIHVKSVPDADGIQNYFFNFMRDVSTYKTLNAESIVVRLYAKSTTKPNLDLYQLEGVDDNYYIYGDVNVWIDISMNMWKTSYADTLDSLANHNFPLFWIYSEGIDIYIDEIFVVETEANGVLESYSQSSDLGLVKCAWDYDGGETAYLEEYQGRNGVVMVTDNKAYNGYSFKINTDLSALTWDYIDINIYIPTASVKATDDIWLNWGATVVPTDVSGNPVVPNCFNDGTWQLDQWSTIRLYKEYIVDETGANTPEAVETFITEFTGNGAIVFWGSELGEIYIDSITYGVNPTE